MNSINLKDAFDSLPARVADATARAAEQLKKLHIRYALIGGIAVGAHGYPRATTDVDFLVGEEAYDHNGPIVTFKPGVPIEINGVRIDYLSPVSLIPQLEEVLNNPAWSEGLAIVPVEVLIYTKLVAGRRRDLSDVGQLIEAGADIKRTRDYLEQYASDLVASFDKLVSESFSDQQR